jgi:3-hydroxy-9,10-secoandrosta-1,3,5(10)-triene-9,17-dione monooxygenase reductase component
MGTEPISENAYRDVMSGWASGVSVVSSLGPAGPDGCTVSAVASLSLDPPRILVCLDLGSNTLTALRCSHRFAINVLAVDQGRLADRFSGKAAASGDKFRDVGHRLVHDTPVLDGTLGWVVCDVAGEFPGGDHVIVVGSPVGAQMQDGAEPLLFFRRSYHHGVPLEPAPVGAAG